jgi:hypothetical protein
MYMSCEDHIAVTTQAGLQESDGDSDEDRASEAPSSRGMRRQRVPAPREELKMVLVVNDELRMGKGKIGGSGATHICVQN